MLEQIGNLSADKALYLASDFHLGVPGKDTSDIRESRIVKWLEKCRKDAAAIILAGDIFDFWFEYKHAIPKGFIRLQGKLAEISDSGIPIIFFTGNHDMWRFDYFSKELGITIYREPQIVTLNNKRLLIGHGDGLGPGDFSYKILKRIFSSKISQWLFARFHPNFGIGIANMWSRKSRITNSDFDDSFDPDHDMLYKYCKAREEKEHFDYYIFGHRHFPIKTPISDSSWYINLGEWVHSAQYVRFDGETADLIFLN